MSQDSSIVVIDGIPLNPEHVNKALLEVQNYYIPMDRIVSDEEVLGRGGFGIVRRATLRPQDSGTGTPVTVVIKALRVDDLRVLPLRAAYRLVREMSVWAKCEHKNILQFIGYHLGENYDPAYLISPYMKNGNISEYLEKNQIYSGKGLRLIRDTLNGLNYLHTRKPPIVHGDLKAANVLVNDDHTAQLGDFGLSTAIHEDHRHTGLTTSTAFTGSIRWCGPEILDDEEGVERTCASDIWAWACLVLEMMTGKIPYSNVKSEIKVIVTVVGKKKTPEPDPEPNLPGSLLSLMIDPLLRDCWKFESDKRPTALSCQSMLDAVTSKAYPFGYFRSRESKVPQSDISHNQNAENDSGYSVVELPPELPGRLEVSTQKFTSGSFAEVYQGKWVREDGVPVTVAIKRVRLPSKNILEEQFRTRIKRETVIWAMAKHPNIVPFIGYQIDIDGVPMLVSPWCRNGNLSTYIKARPNLPRQERVRLLHSAACGLAYLHTLIPPIVHGDVKPADVIIQDNGEAGLCDFGISKIVVAAGQRTGLTTTGNTLGTKGFQAAEVLQDEPVTTASDVYAFGGVILFAMSGKAPFEGKSTAAVVMAVITGKIPRSIDHPLLPAMDPMWRLYKACSDVDPKGRPSMPNLVSKLEYEMQDP